ncbi:unnamed protein product [Phaeothamnion confervicola]
MAQRPKLRGNQQTSHVLMGERAPTPTRNFARDHRRTLRDMEERNRHRQEEHEESKPEPFKLKQFKQVPSKVAETLRAPPNTSATPEAPRRDYLRRGSGGNRATELRTRAMQERFPVETSEARRAKRASVPPKSPVPRRDEAPQLAPRSGTDFVVENRLRAVEPRRSPPPTPPADAPLEKEDFGIVPKYLVQRKERWAAEEAAHRAAAPDPDCPPGMAAMPDSERVETLRLLGESEREAQRQLSRLPLVLQTPSMRRRKDDLEARLREIEAAQAIFSRPKVYVAKK